MTRTITRKTDDDNGDVTGDDGNNDGVTGDDGINGGEPGGADHGKDDWQ